MEECIVHYMDIQFTIEHVAIKPETYETLLNSKAI